MTSSASFKIRNRPVVTPRVGSQQLHGSMSASLSSTGTVAHYTKHKI